jgi:hypothetical protein
MSMVTKPSTYVPLITGAFVVFATICIALIVHDQRIAIVSLGIAIVLARAFPSSAAPIFMLIIALRAVACTGPRSDPIALGICTYLAAAAAVCEAMILCAATSETMVDLMNMALFRHGFQYVIGACLVVGIVFYAPAPESMLMGAGAGARVAIMLVSGAGIMASEREKEKTVKKTTHGLELAPAACKCAHVLYTKDVKTVILIILLNILVIVKSSRRRAAAITDSTGREENSMQPIYQHV